MRRLSIIILALSLVVASCQRGAFTKAELGLIRQENSLMRVLKVQNLEDSLSLRMLSTDMPDAALQSEDYALLAKKLVATVTSPEEDGVGIAGPQVGINRRVVAVWRSDKPGEPFEVYANVRIDTLFGQKCPGREGCLSIPGLRGNVRRWTDAVVSYTDPQTHQRLRDTVSGYTAVIFQHECDHLDGILYTDRADSL